MRVNTGYINPIRYILTLGVFVLFCLFLNFYPAWLHKEGILFSFFFKRNVLLYVHALSRTWRARTHTHTHTHTRTHARTHARTHTDQHTLLIPTVVLRRSCSLCIYFLAMYCRTNVMLYCAWSSYLELGQALYQFKTILSYPAWLHREGIRLDLISF